MLALVDLSRRRADATGTRWPFTAAGTARRRARPSRATAPGARSRRRSRRAGRSRRCRATATTRRGGTGVRALVCGTSPGLADAVGRRRPRPVAAADERPLGRDQSNTSVVLGERLLLKAYRRIQPGLNPDLELTAYLSEEAAFPGRAAARRLGGGRDARRAARRPSRCSRRSCADADDAYEATAERLAALDRARRTPPDLEAATDLAEDLGIAGRRAPRGARVAAARTRRTSRPRPATHDELRAWRIDAHAPAERGGRRPSRPVDRGLADELRARRARDHRPLSRGSRPSPRRRS